jgi:hypothetical protein
LEGTYKKNEPDRGNEEEEEEEEEEEGRYKNSGGLQRKIKRKRLS